MIIMKLCLTMMEINSDWAILPERSSESIGKEREREKEDTRASSLSVSKRMWVVDEQEITLRYHVTTI